MRLRLVPPLLTLVFPPVLAVVGCDRGQEPATRHEAEARRASEPETPEAPVDTEPASKTEPEGTANTQSLAARREAVRKRHSENPEQGKERGKALMASVNEGRKLVKEGKLEEGIAKYEEALAIDPNFRPAIGEIGWAQFNAGHYQQAHAHSLRALDLAETDKQRGMYLYNLGRIAEATGDVDEAIARYQVSLAKRPNKVVRKRLDGLLADYDGPVVDATTERGLAVLATASSQAELCEAAAREGMCTSTDECDFDHQTKGANASFGLLFSGDEIEGCYHVVVEHDSTFSLLEAVSVSQMGSDLVQGLERAESKIERTDAGEFWVLQLADGADGHGWNDIDPEMVFFEAEKVVVCQWTDRGPACTTPIATSYEGESEAHGRERYAATVTVEHDRIVVDSMTHSLQLNDVDDDVSTEQPLFLPVGRYPFHDLARRPL